MVDDEDNITFLLSSALRHFGFEVEVAATGRQALEAVSSFAPDLVLLDVMLPDLDGFEVVRRLRSDGVTMPVLFLTARDTTEDRVRGLTLGGDDYVAKPFSLEEVVARIHAILRRHGHRQPLVAGGPGRPGDGRRRPSGRPRRRGRSSCRRPSTSCCASCSSTRAGSSPGPRSSTTSGSTTSAATRNVVDTYISYLRKKVDRFEPPLIQTIRGVGYSLRVE